MIVLDRPVIVEGKYDKQKLSAVLDATIITTNGFGIFNDREKRALIRRLAEKNGIIVLTDADGAGFVIGNHIKSAISGKYLKQADTPDVFGKERRKKTGRKEGKLGVEDMTREVILESLRRAGATFEAEGETAKRQEITKADLMDLCLYGPGSAEKRAALIKKLGFPEKMSTNAFLQALNLLYSLDELKETLEKHNG